MSGLHGFRGTWLTPWQGMRFRWISSLSQMCCLCCFFYLIDFIWPMHSLWCAMLLVWNTCDFVVDNQICQNEFEQLLENVEFFTEFFSSESSRPAQKSTATKRRQESTATRATLTSLSQHGFCDGVPTSVCLYQTKKTESSCLEHLWTLICFVLCVHQKPGTFRCGGGNAAQVVSCLFGARYKVTAISLYADEAERWDKAVKEAGGMTCNFQGTNKSVQSVPDLITKDPSAVKNCDVVLLTVPSSFHEPLGKCWNIENVSKLKAKGAKDLFDLSFLSDHPVLVPSAWSTLPPMWNGKLSVLVLAMLWMADVFYVGLLQLREYFSKLEPYVQPGTVFAVMPARSGCDFLFKKVPKVYGKKTNCTNYKRTILYTDNLWLYLWLLVWYGYMRCQDM